jgi:3',5'-cyclic-AMP phosphodiesterase
MALRIAWLTDIHLEFLSHGEVDAFFERLSAHDPEAVLVGGDTGTAATLSRFLSGMEERLQRPIYFVLGNHDFYGGSIREVRRAAADLAARSRWLHWLPDAGVVLLTDRTGLVGHGSWADGRLGSGVGSNVLLNDYLQIRDFQPLGHQERFQKLNELGDEAAAFVEELLPSAAERFGELIFLTHVPPFREAAWHEGQASADDWLPHFSCRAVGDVLVRVMTAHPGCALTVLCGHTHGEGRSASLRTSWFERRARSTESRGSGCSRTFGEAGARGERLPPLCLARPGPPMRLGPGVAPSLRSFWRDPDLR